MKFRRKNCFILNFPRRSRRLYNVFTCFFRVFKQTGIVGFDFEDHTCYRVLARSRIFRPFDRRDIVRSGFSDWIRGWEVVPIPLVIDFEIPSVLVTVVAVHMFFRGRYDKACCALKVLGNERLCNVINSSKT